MKKSTRDGPTKRGGSLWMVLLFVAGCGGSASTPSTPARPPVPPLPEVVEAKLPWIPRERPHTWEYLARKNDGPPMKLTYRMKPNPRNFNMERWVGPKHSQGELLKGRGIGRIWWLVPADDPTFYAGWRPPVKIGFRPALRGGLLIPDEAEPGYVWHNGDSKAVDYEEVFVPAYSRSLRALRIDHYFVDQGRDGTVLSLRITQWWRRGVGLVRERRSFVPAEWGPGDPEAKILYDDALAAQQAASYEARPPPSGKDSENGGPRNPYRLSDKPKRRDRSPRELGPVARAHRRLYISTGDEVESQLVWWH